MLTMKETRIAQKNSWRYTLLTKLNVRIHGNNNINVSHVTIKNVYTTTQAKDFYRCTNAKTRRTSAAAARRTKNLSHAQQAPRKPSLSLLFSIFIDFTLTTHSRDILTLYAQCFMVLRYPNTMNFILNMILLMKI